MKKNIDLIDDDNYTQLYKRCSIPDRTELTAVLYECDIDPLQYMTEIPAMFAYKVADLTNITIPNGAKSIGFQAFCDCVGLTNIEIPNSVTSIASDAFWGCSGLTSITIPNSVTSIGNCAFYGCGNILISYSGTKQQWKNLITGVVIFPETTYVCNCSDGVVEKNGDIL